MEKEKNLSILTSSCIYMTTTRKENLWFYSVCYTVVIDWVQLD